MTDQAEDFLAHFGVMGMHWGRHLPGRGEKTGTHPDHRQAHSLDKKPIHQLSNNDLKALNSRNELEKKLKKARSEKTKVAKGKAAVSAILATAAVGTTVFNLVNSPAGKVAINKAKPVVKFILHRLANRAGIPNG